ncbi:phage holin family protein [Lysinibacillus sp. GbtcB16]|uniref:phage holin family protein n=1 Tax=Lysinibacillus sp. GbtcB16 TaxID=2824761 RepID=UPI001C2FBD55|nr:phage holin family protein [Lysinibacillus sp. GbtcB16]
MENITIGGILSFLGGSIVWLVGGWTATLTALSIFMVVEIILRLITFISGRKKLTANNMAKHFGRKAGVMLVIILANQLDIVAGGVPVFKTIAILYYIGVEGLKCKEHLEEIGLYFPKAMMDKIQAMNDERKDNE